jgi:hypothetical protein
VLKSRFGAAANRTFPSAAAGPRATEPIPSNDVPQILPLIPQRCNDIARSNKTCQPCLCIFGGHSELILLRRFSTSREDKRSTTRTNDSASRALSKLPRCHLLIFIFSCARSFSNQVLYGAIFARLLGMRTLTMILMWRG